MNVKVNHITTTEYFTKAKRPLNSRLSKEKTWKYFSKLRIWNYGINMYLKGE